MTPHRPRRQVLVLAYYFPPMGLSGVQRIAKFVKYLPDFGWDPTVVTPEPGGYFAFDPDLLEELSDRSIPIVRTRSFDPTRAFSKGSKVSLPREGRRRLLSGLSQWLFLPDNKIGWMPFAYRAAAAQLKGGGFSAILSTAPPYSSHLVAARLAKRFGVPLVLDYRDDWLENPRHEYPTRMHRAIHARLERQAGGQASAIVTINKVIGDRLQKRLSAPGDVVPQGFDPEDYKESRPDEEAVAGSTIEFIYTGVFYDRQTPEPFLRGLAELFVRRPEMRSRLKAKFVGLFPPYADKLVAELGLGPVVEVIPYQKHREAMQHVMRADVPWLTVGDGPGQESISTGKLFAYMGSHKPILGLVPEGAARASLLEYGASWTVHPADISGIADTLSRIVAQRDRRELPVPTPEVIARHDRRELAGKLAGVLDRVTS